MFYAVTVEGTEVYPKVPEDSYFTFRSSMRYVNLDVDRRISLDTIDE